MNLKTRLFVIGMVLLTILLVVGCQPNSANNNAQVTPEVMIVPNGDAPLTCDGENMTIVDWLTEDSSLSAFGKLIIDSGLVTVLQSSEQRPHTVFAFTNDAYTALDDAAHDLLSDPVSLQRYAAYHIARGVLKLDAMEDGAEITTLGGEPLIAHPGEPTILNNGIKVLASYKACNGIVYVIDGLLIPVDPEG
jgi:uncharacterized surface protein with fasciclin (FAS1) repeats